MFIFSEQDCYQFMPENEFKDYPCSEAEQERIDNLESLCKEFKEKGYKFKSNENSIHSEDAIRFTKEYFQVDDWTLQTLENGYKAEIRGRVPDYKEKNNKSTMSDLEIF